MNSNEIISLLGTPLNEVPLTTDQIQELEQQLKQAKADLDADPDDPELWIMYGRRLAYLWKYRQAIKVFTEALDMFPTNGMLYRHRGHRYISIRKLTPAERDLTRASELITDDFDVWYHLGLARWLIGDFVGALSAYRECWNVTPDDDLRVAIAHWMYMTLKRLGKDEEAQMLIKDFEPTSVEENVHYCNLIRFYQQKLSEEQVLELCQMGDLDDATMGFGLGVWHLIEGNTTRAKKHFQRVLQGSYWSAFGFIGAEVELARM